MAATMTYPGTVSALLTASSMLLSGCLLCNVFILTAIILCRTQTSQRALPTNELLIGNLALVNIFTGVSNFLWLVVYLLGLCQHTGEWIYQVLDFVSMSSSSTGFWFTACLSAFYTLKISRFNTPLLTHLRLRASAAMPYLLLFILLSCFVLSAPTIAYVSLKKSNSSNVHCGDYYIMSGPYAAYINCFSILGYLLPMAMLTVCSVLLVVLLFRHSRRMGNSPGDPRVAVHVRVAKMVLLLLGFYTLCVVFVQVSDQFYVLTSGGSGWFITYSFVLLVYSTGFPFMLTWGTVRLKQLLLKVCGCSSCCVTTGPNDSVAATRSTAPEDVIGFHPKWCRNDFRDGIRVKTFTTPE